MAKRREDGELEGQIDIGEALPDLSEALGWADDVLAKYRDQAQIEAEPLMVQGPETQVQPEPEGNKYDRRMYCPNCGHRRNDAG